MKTLIALLAIAAMLASFVQAQQNPSTSQPTPAQVPSAAASTAPCNKTAATPPRKPGYLENKMKALACKQNKNLCDVPSSPVEITGGTPDNKPCPANPVAGSIPVKAQPTPAPPIASTTAPSNVKPILVCPPKSTLIPGFPYCLNPDRSVVDAIALPASLSAPTAPAPAPPAQAQH